MYLCPNNIQQTRPNIHHYTKLLPGMVEYYTIGNVIVPCYRSIGNLYMSHRFIITLSPAPYLSNISNLSSSIMVIPYTIPLEVYVSIKHPLNKHLSLCYWVDESN